MSGPVGARDGDPPKSLPDFDLALVLSGGNALGAFQAGAYQQLHEAGLEPALVSGASAGAINGAIICGAPPDQRVSRLEAFWKPAARSAWGMTMFEEARRTAAAVGAIAGGQPDLFVPRHLWGPWWNPFGNPEPSSLYDATALEHRLAQLIDFDLLNDGATPFCATAVNVETGENVVLDTRQHGSGRAISARALRSSRSFLPSGSMIGGWRMEDFPRTCRSIPCWPHHLFALYYAWRSICCRSIRGRLMGWAPPRRAHRT